MIARNRALLQSPFTQSALEKAFLQRRKNIVHPALEQDMPDVANPPVQKLTVEADMITFLKTDTG